MSVEAAKDASTEDNAFNNEPHASGKRGKESEKCQKLWQQREQVRIRATIPGKKAEQRLISMQWTRWLSVT